MISKENKQNRGFLPLRSLLVFSLIISLLSITGGSSLAINNPDETNSNNADNSSVSSTSVAKDDETVSTPSGAVTDNQVSNTADADKPTSADSAVTGEDKTSADPTGNANQDRSATTNSYRERASRAQEKSRCADPNFWPKGKINVTEHPELFKPHGWMYLPHNDAEALNCGFSVYQEGADKGRPITRRYNPRVPGLYYVRETEIVPKGEKPILDYLQQYIIDDGGKDGQEGTFIPVNESTQFVPPSSRVNFTGQNYLPNPTIDLSISDKYKYVGGNGVINTGVFYQVTRETESGKPGYYFQVGTNGNIQQERAGDSYVYMPARFSDQFGFSDTPEVRYSTAILSSALEPFAPNGTGGALVPDFARVYDLIVEDYNTFLVSNVGSPNYKPNKSTRLDDQLTNAEVLAKLGSGFTEPLKGDIGHNDKINIFTAAVNYLNLHYTQGLPLDDMGSFNMVSNFWSNPEPHRAEIAKKIIMFLHAYVEAARDREFFVREHQNQKVFLEAKVTGTQIDSGTNDITYTINVDNLDNKGINKAYFELPEGVTLVSPSESEFEPTEEHGRKRYWLKHRNDGSYTSTFKVKSKVGAIDDPIKQIDFGQINLKQAFGETMVSNSTFYKDEKTGRWVAVQFARAPTSRDDYYTGTLTEAPNLPVVRYNSIEHPVERRISLDLNFSLATEAGIGILSYFDEKLEPNWPKKQGNKFLPALLPSNEHEAAKTLVLHDKLSYSGVNTSNKYAVTTKVYEVITPANGNEPAKIKDTPIYENTTRDVVFTDTKGEYEVVYEDLNKQEFRLGNTYVVYETISVQNDDGSLTEYLVHHDPSDTKQQFFISPIEINSTTAGIREVEGNSEDAGWVVANPNASAKISSEQADKFKDNKWVYLKDRIEFSGLKDFTNYRITTKLLKIKVDDPDAKPIPVKLKDPGSNTVSDSYITRLEFRTGYEPDSPVEIRSIPENGDSSKKSLPVEGEVFVQDPPLSSNKVTATTDGVYGTAPVGKWVSIFGADGTFYTRTQASGVNGKFQALYDYYNKPAADSTVTIVYSDEPIYAAQYDPNAPYAGKETAKVYYVPGSSESQRLYGHIDVKPVLAEKMEKNYRYVFTQEISEYSIDYLPENDYRPSEVESGSRVAHKNLLDLQESIEIDNPERIIKISKSDASGKTYLPGADFAIYDDNDGRIGQKSATVTVTNNDPVDGKNSPNFTVEKLLVGKSYWLVETKAPFVRKASAEERYSLLAQPLRFKVTKDGLTIYDNGVAVTKKNDFGEYFADGGTFSAREVDGTWFVKVHDTRVAELPSAGGNGHLGMVLLAMILVIAGCYGMYKTFSPRYISKNIA